MKKEKHLYKDIVDEYYEKEINYCISHNRSFEVIEKFKSNNYKYVLSGDYPNFSNKYVEDITVQDVKTLKKDIITRTMKSNLSVLTVGHIFGNIDRVLKYCSEKTYIDDTLFDNVRITPIGVKRQKITIRNFLLKKEFDY